MPTPDYLAVLREIDAAVDAVRAARRKVEALLSGGALPESIFFSLRDRMILKALDESERDLDLASDATILAAYGVDQIVWTQA